MNWFSKQLLEKRKVIELNPQVWYLAGSGIESLDIMLSDVEPAVAKD